MRRRYRVTDKATGEVHHLTADELARIPLKHHHVKHRGRRVRRLIEIRDIPQGGWTRGGVHHAREPLRGHHADIVPGVSIRLHGVDTNRYDGPRAYDLTFRVGDSAVYGSHNLTYTGRIASIGAKTVAITEDHGSRVHRLTIADFSERNDDFDAEKISARNLAWSD